MLKPEYQLFNRKTGGGLWVGKRYAKAGKRNPDPLKGLSHAATVSQVCRFYYLLATGRLVSAEKSRRMLEIMAYPQTHHKFVSFLDDHYALSRIFRKSGTWRHFHADSAIIEREDYRYIAVALAQNEHGGKWLTDLIVTLDGLIGFSRAQSFSLYDIPQ